MQFRRRGNDKYLPAVRRAVPVPVRRGKNSDSNKFFGVSLGRFHIGLGNPMSMFKKSWAELHAFFDNILKTSGSKATITSQLEEYRSWVHIAVSAIYRRVGEVNYKYVRTDTQQIVKPRDQGYNTINDIFRRPNPFMSYRFMKTFWQLQLDLTGMAFGLRVDDAFGKPLEIWPLNVDWFVKLQRGKTWTDWITGFTFLIDGKYKTYSPEHVLYFYYPHPEDPMVGCSPIKNQAYAIDVDHYIEVYERDFFRNSARPDFLLKYPQGVGVDEDDATAIKEQWRKSFAGPGNYHNIGIVDEGGDIMQLSPKNAELDLMFLANWSGDKILAAYNVPPGKVGLVKDVNRANAVGIDITFNSECIKPRLDIHDDVMTRMVLERFDPVLCLKHENPIPRDRELDIKEIDKKVGVPMWTINEAREMAGMEPVQGGDVVFVPLNFVQISGPGETPPAEPDQDGESRILIGKDAEPFTYPEEYKDKRWNVFAKHISVWEMLWMNALSSMFEQQQEEVLRKIDKFEHQSSIDTENLKLRLLPEYSRLINLYEGWSIKKIEQDVSSDVLRFKHLFSDSKQAEVFFRNVARGAKAGDMLKELLPIVIAAQETRVQTLLFDWDRNVERFNSRGQKLFTETMREHGQQELNMLGLDMSFDLENKNARRFIGDKTRQFSRDVLSTQADRLERTLTEGFSAGENGHQLAQRVKDTYRGYITKGYDAKRIARTEVVSASNAGSFFAYDQSGVVQDKEWLAVRDKRTRGASADDRADHYHMDGQRVPMDMPFVDPRSNSRLQWPGDTSLGAGGKDIIMCRCTMLPYVTSTTRREPTYRDIKDFQRKYGLQGVGTARVRRMIRSCYA